MKKLGGELRQLTDKQILAALRTLTPAQLQLFTMFLLIEKRVDRDLIIDRLKSA